MDHWSRRTDDIHTEEVDGSHVVYDRRNDEVHCLDDRATQVYLACDGRTAAEIAEVTGESVEVVDAHIAALAKRGLVDHNAPGVDRRRFVAGTAAHAAIAVGIWSLTAPTPAAAASGSQPLSTLEPLTTG
jgi:hypothetical protein